MARKSKGGIDPIVAAVYVQLSGRSLRVQAANISRRRSECMTIEVALKKIAEGHLAVVSGSDMPELRRRFANSVATPRERTVQKRG